MRVDPDAEIRWFRNAANRGTDELRVTFARLDSWRDIRARGLNRTPTRHTRTERRPCAIKRRAPEPMTRARACCRRDAEARWDSPGRQALDRHVTRQSAAEKVMTALALSRESERRQRLGRHLPASVKSPTQPPDPRCCFRPLSTKAEEWTGDDRGRPGTADSWIR